MLDRVVWFVLFLLAAIFIYWIGSTTKHSNKKASSTVDAVELNEKFTSMVTEKYTYRGCRVIIQTANGKFEISPTSECLYDSTRVGDTIVKEANSNNCLIKRGYTVQCKRYSSRN